MTIGAARATAALALVAVAAGPAGATRAPSAAPATSALAPTPTPAATTPVPVEPTPIVTAADLEDLCARGLRFPVPAVSPAAVRDSFAEQRGDRRHEAIDVVAPRGAAVVAVDDGVVAKLFESVPGGRTIYLFDVGLRFAYYYAHLDGYAPGLTEGGRVRKGDAIATVGTSGNAADATPHLHFAIFKLEPAPRWWRGTPLDPYPLLVLPGCAPGAEDRRRTSRGAARRVYSDAALRVDSDAAPAPARTQRVRRTSDGCTVGE